MNHDGECRSHDGLTCDLEAELKRQIGSLEFEVDRLRQGRDLYRDDALALRRLLDERLGELVGLTAMLRAANERVNTANVILRRTRGMLQEEVDFFRSTMVCPLCHARLSSGFSVCPHGCHSW